MDDRELLSVRALIRAMGERRLSPVELLQHSLRQIKAHNKQLNAIYEIDEDAAMRCAKLAELRWAEKRPAGRLDGIPSTAKDALALSGFRAYRGTAAMEPNPRPSAEDAPVNARLKFEGAILMGKATMCDLGILPSGRSSKHGIARNPWNIDRTPGGSSSGSAAAVAAGLHSFAIGTDIVGSIRLPAAFCGIYGFKPSQGRVPYYPQSSPALVAGPLTHTVEDAALLMDIISGQDDRDFTALPRERYDFQATLAQPLRIGKVGIVRDLGFMVKPSAECLAVVEKASQILRDLGWTTIDLDGPFLEQDLTASENFYRVRCDAELRKSQARREKSGVVDRWTAPVELATARDLFDWYLAQQACRAKVNALMRDVDFLLLPPTLTTALPAEYPTQATEIFQPWAQTFLFNLSEQPAASLPMGLSPEGLPLGLQIVGRRHDDHGVMQLSALLERARGPFPLSPCAKSVTTFAPAPVHCYVPFH